MKIAIIGAGFVGLSAAYRLTKEGHDVTIFEMARKPGGLAAGFRDKKWNWSLEEHYHHWFTTDNYVRDLAEEIGTNVSFPRPKSSVLVNNNIYQLDSPFSLLKFPHLSLIDRVRTGVTLAYLKVTPFWKMLERVTAKEFLIKTMGENSFRVLWEDLFVGKFGTESAHIPASWFWARIKKRSASLGYPDGGFGLFAESIAKKVINSGGKIRYRSTVDVIEEKDSKLSLLVKGKQTTYDSIICTLPTSLFSKITKSLPDSYKEKIKPLKGTGAVTLVLAMKEKFFEDETYWLNVSQKGYPFLAVVEHTNLISKKNYGGDHILYVGNYVKPSHKYFTQTATELLNLFAPKLKKINKFFSKDNVRKAWVFRAPFAQPIVPLNYSKNVPPNVTPIKGLYLANMQQVYPWDRGTNYAVELGFKVASLVLERNS